MKKLLQINTVCNTGSTGRIAEELGLIALKKGWESYIAFGRGDSISASHKYRIGNDLIMYGNALNARLFDSEGFEAGNSTRKLIQYIDEIKPDIIHLHNLHGYYVNVEILFHYLKTTGIPVVWTLHDCWSFTGHCTHFDYVGCYKWIQGCNNCPQKKEYPSSLLADNSKVNFLKKKQLFKSIPNLTIVTPSHWLFDLVKNSFLSNHSSKVINNGIDTNVFKPCLEINITKKYNLGTKKIILGVASTWSERKGLRFFEELSNIIPVQLQIVLIGLSKKQIKKLPLNIIGIEKTANVEELAELYSIAEVFINPTLEDNFPTTNLEAMACGTPVITFQTGGSVESISSETGLIVPKEDLIELKAAVDQILKNGKEYYSEACRKRAIQLYNCSDKFLEYFALYNKLVSK